MQNSNKNQIDYFITILPTILIVILCICFIIAPSVSNQILSKIRYFCSNTCAYYYLIFGFSIFILSLFIAFSKIGKIKLGEKNEKPKYSFFQWGGMIFCAGLAADILFYSFSEWLLYINEEHIKSMGDVYAQALTHSLFHWGPTPWSFYLVLASAFGFMIHIRKKNKQKYSESLRPILKNKTDGIIGKTVDIFAVFALIAGCATTFSLATPLMSELIKELFHIEANKFLTIILLLIVCACYIASLLNGLKGINILSKICMYIFIFFLLYVLIASKETSFIITNAITPLKNLIVNFIPMSLFKSKTTTFYEDYTAFYWAYWMVWCVAAPFFIGQVSKGRTIKQLILGGYIFGLLSTFCSFIILTGYSQSLQINNIVNLEEIYNKTQSLYVVIIESLKYLPFKNLVYVILFISMICFYATSFDSISLVASYYSYKNISFEESPKTSIKLFWAILLILFPIALTFSDSSMQNLQAVSIIAAFPIGIVIILIIIAFIKDATSYLKNESKL